MTNKEKSKSFCSNLCLIDCGWYPCHIHESAAIKQSLWVVVQATNIMQAVKLGYRFDGIWVKIQVGIALLGQDAIDISLAVSHFLEVMIGHHILCRQISHCHWKIYHPQLSILEFLFAQSQPGEVI